MAALARVAVLIRQQGRRQRLFKRPLQFIQAVAQHYRAYLETPRPVGQRQRFALMGQPSNPAAIQRLNSLCGPSAVVWRVGTVVIDAIQRAIWRAASHVRKERQITRAPAFAHVDASTAVVFECRIARRMAAPFGVLPAPILFGFLFPITLTVCAAGFAGSLTLQAPTRLRVAASELRQRHGDALPTVAEAVPMRTAAERYARDRNQSTEPLVSGVNPTRHQSLILHPESA